MVATHQLPKMRSVILPSFNTRYTKLITMLSCVKVDSLIPGLDFLVLRVIWSVDPLIGVSKMLVFYEVAQGVTSSLVH